MSSLVKSVVASSAPVQTSRPTAVGRASPNDGPISELYQDQGVRYDGGTLTNQFQNTDKDDSDKRQHQGGPRTLKISGTSRQFTAAFEASGLGNTESHDHYRGGLSETPPFRAFIAKAARIYEANTAAIRGERSSIGNKMNYAL